MLITAFVSKENKIAFDDRRLLIRMTYDILTADKNDNIFPLFANMVFMFFIMEAHGNTFS